jgi:hypothetical protein
MVSEKTIWDGVREENLGTKVPKTRNRNGKKRKEKRNVRELGEVGSLWGVAFYRRGEVGAASRYAKEKCGLSARETEAVSVG